MRVVEAGLHRGLQVGLRNAAEPVVAEQADISGERMWRLRRGRCCLLGERPTETYTQLGARLDMSETAVKVTVHRLRQRYGELLRAEIAHTVARPEEVDDELRHLIAALST